MEKVLGFEGSPKEIDDQLNQFHNALVSERRKGWFGLAGLFIKDLSDDQKKRIEFARQVVLKLGEDAKQGKLEGQLDLNGWRQTSKLTRAGRTRRGHAKQYYHDPWFKVRAKLVDGNVARLSVLAKVKLKIKRKGDSVIEKDMVSVRLGVNQRVYDFVPKDREPQADPRTISVQMKDGELQLVGSMLGVKADPVLDRLKMAYGYLALRKKAQMRAVQEQG